MSGGSGDSRRGRGSRRPRSRRQARLAPEGDTVEYDARLLEVHERLDAEYGAPRPGDGLDPLEEVVFTILSQNTTDTNRDRAWENLWETFDGWPEIAAAPTSTIARAIRVGGLHRVKAKRIKELLRQVAEARGGYDLDHLTDADMAAARKELARYRGLGEKSINCVLLFSLGHPAFPVDTHVHRVLRRVGILETNDLGRANRQMQGRVPPDLSYPLHMNIIRHGREVCDAQRPRCWECVIEELCEFEDKPLPDPAES